VEHLDACFSAHSGTMDVTSTEKGGTTFTMSLPRRPPLRRGGIPIEHRGKMLRRRSHTELETETDHELLRTKARLAPGA
jgi:hypothetical protein